jgi:hypothetical protein
MLILLILGLLMVAAGAYVYGVHVGTMWGRDAASESYQRGRDDAIRYVQYL